MAYLEYPLCAPERERVHADSVFEFYVFIMYLMLREIINLNIYKHRKSESAGSNAVPDTANGSGPHPPPLLSGRQQQWITSTLIAF
jgi:hypothetical protein